MRSLGYLLSEGLKSLWKNRTMSIASVVVLSSCLLITGVAVLLSLNMEQTMRSIESNNQITIILDDETSKIKVIEIGDQIRDIDNTDNCVYVPPSNALIDIMGDLGAEDGTLFLGSDDFLPDAYTISIINLSIYAETIDQIMEIDGVESISDYSNIAEKLTDLDHLIRYIGLGFIAILGLVSLFIISNTLKVTMFTRRTEINIMKSVGATNLFIRIPFFVEGMLIGLISGGLSSMVIYYAYDKLSEVIINLVPFLDFFNIKNYATELFVSYGILGVTFGILGGFISIGRYLKREGEKAII